MRDETLVTDILIAGGGLSGMIASLESAKAGNKIVLTSKGKFGNDGASYITRAGFSVAFENTESSDSKDLYFKDIIKSGCNINNPELVHTLVNLAPKLIDYLSNNGVHFDIINNHFKQYLGGGHSRSRMLYTVNKNGADITLPLSEKVKKQPNINILEDIIILDIKKEDNIFIVNLAVPL